MAFRVINDRRHSQLSRGRAPSQLRIDGLEEGPGPAAYGKCKVLEVSSRAALTDFTMGGHVTGVAWSLNPYVGCLHGCAYCYVPDTMRVERRRWGSYIVAKQNLPALLEKELRDRRRMTVYVSTATDPYQSAEADWRITRKCLALLAKKDWPVEILTRSPLVLRDLDLLRRFTQLRVGLSVPTLDDRARRLLEPAAPAIPARLRTLRRLADRGLSVFANYSPAYPFTGGVTAQRVAEAFRDAGVGWVNTSHWRRAPSFLGNLWDRLRRTEWADLTKHIGDARLQEALRLDLARAMGDVGVPLHTGFFNPTFESNPDMTSVGSAQTVSARMNSGPRLPAAVLEIGGSGWGLDS